MAAAFSLLVGAPARTAMPDAVRAKLEPRLQRALEAPGPRDWLAIGVTLQSDDLPPPGQARRARVAARQARLLDAVAGHGFRLRHRYRMLSGVSGFAKPDAVEALARHPDVRSVYLDARAYPTLSQGSVQIGADQAHALGVTGAGVNVAVLDTGIDTDHPDLADDLVAEQCFCADSHPSPRIGNSCCPNGQDTQSGPGAAEDDAGHGTSVSGIITSGGVVAPRGVAPDAGIVALRVSGPQGALFSDIAAGLDWVLENRDAFGNPIRAVNISLSDGTEYDDPTQSPCSGTNTANAIEDLHAAGIPTFVSSGNDGFDDGVAFPGCNVKAISVGGVYDSYLTSVSWCGNAQCTTTLCTDTNTTPDSFVCHSNSGEILDLLAPDYQTATPGLGGGIQGSFGGTSASSPYAAAQAALLFQADPGLDADAVLTGLTSSGVTVTNPDSGLSFPRSDVGEAVTALVASCGNGAVEPGEECDDGGTLDGDCCAADCSFETSGSGCDDADACTTLDACDGAGSCVGGPPLSCNDANVCTDDSCNPGSGCVFTPNTAPCDDADACTTLDACDGAGSCVGGPPLVCGNADACTAESCDALLGCVSSPIEGCAVRSIPALPRHGTVLLLGLLASAGVWTAARPR